MVRRVSRILFASTLLLSTGSWAQEPAPAPAKKPAPAPAEKPAPAPAENAQPAQNAPPASSEPAPAPSPEAPPADATSTNENAPASEEAADAPSTEEAGSAAATDEPVEGPTHTLGTASPPEDSDDDYAKVQPVAADESHLQKNPKRGPVFVLGLLYDLGLPLGNTRDFNKKVSGRGFTVEGRYFGPHGIRLGVSFGWQVFQEKLYDSFKVGNATVSGTQIRETTTTPLLFNVGYALERGTAVHPYVRLGLGTGRTWRRVDMGIRRVIIEDWHFAMTPELGIEVPLQRLVVLAALRYNHFFKAGDTPSQSYMNFSVGLGFE